ncbi:radical SAM family protein [Acetobacter malorum]|nr:hypothetical protein [Acetobacter malorum]KXV06747.1 hypothetical protein AD930_06510 [Acetobacter malorum]
MPTPMTMTSSVDQSINHVIPQADGGYYEARFVRRVNDYFICYLSSHTGCSKACRFCHLTTTGQTMMRPSSYDDYMEQARLVFDDYRQALSRPGAVRAARVHFNFMARGEPLENPCLTAPKEFSRLHASLVELSNEFGLEAKFKISSIMPEGYKGEVDDFTALQGVQLYYSLYSLDPSFRKRWLPRAMPPERALDMIAESQKLTGSILVLHQAFIKNENDSFNDVDAIVDAVNKRGIRARFNLVRYNPAAPKYGCEPEEEKLEALFERMSNRLTGGGRGKIVPRVGPDVYASCGMFVP